MLMLLRAAGLVAAALLAADARADAPHYKGKRLAPQLRPGLRGSWACGSGALSMIGPARYGDGRS